MTQDNNVLPEGWTLTQLSNIVASQKGKKPKLLADSPADGFIPYIDIEAFETGNVRRYADITSSSLTNVPDLLIVWDGARCGLVGKSNQAGAIGSTLSALRVSECEPNYLFWFLKSQYQNINGNERGIGIPHVQSEYLWSLEVPIPPLAEQKRIVAQIETLLASVNATRERLAKVPAILKRFRQAVLAAACSGRLTEDWRAQQKDLEPASCLLERIREERRAKMGSKYRESTAPDINELPELPEEWIWANVDSLSTKVVDGVHKTPTYVKEGVPFVTVRNLTAGSSISFEKLNYITDEDHQLFFQRVNPEKGDLLITKDGTIGTVRAIRTDKVFSIFVSVALVKPVLREMTDYFEIALTSPAVQKQMLGVGTGLQHLVLRELKADCIPLPSLIEQQEIVRRVERLFNLADAMEKRVEVAQQRANKLSQAVLARAFRGELVPTEAELARQEGREYETAAALLERIQAERVATKPVKTKAASKKLTTLTMEMAE